MTTLDRARAVGAIVEAPGSSVDRAHAFVGVLRWSGSLGFDAGVFATLATASVHSAYRWPHASVFPMEVHHV